MTLLILGLILWVTAHSFKRLVPGVRDPLGDKGKALVALVILAGVVLMVKGYRAADTEALFTPLAGIGRLNNVLMLVSIFLLGAGHGKGIVAARVRHPMLWGTAVWAAAHLLVNGDLASVVLFGGIGLWTFVQMALINRGEGAWQRPETGPISGDIKVAVITLVLYGVIAGVHTWLGYSPFLGTYT